MEIEPHRFGPDQADIVGQVSVGTMEPVHWLALGAAVEMDDLAGRMHAGVRPPGTEQLNRMIGDPRQGLLDLLLHAAYARLLALPPAVSRPAVFHAGCDSRNNSGRLGGGRFFSCTTHLSAKLLHHFPSILLLLLIPFFHHFREDIPRTLLVAHIDIGAG